MHNNFDLLESKILIVDDNPSNVLLVQRMLEYAEYREIRSLTDPTKVMDLVRTYIPDLLILDLHMPNVNGFQIMEQINGQMNDHYLPILVFTADATVETRKRALQLGASDFLTKPGDATEIQLRVRNFLTIRALHKRLSDQNLLLEERIRERTASLQEAQREILDRLARAAEFRDEDTGEHTVRVAEMSAQIANCLGLGSDEIEIIRQAARLHDVGKIGVPDSILLRTGRLSDEEYEIMRSHAQIGADLLSGSSSQLLQVAERIARSHHEWWDGSGYPHHLEGEDIPLEGRIVAIADVYDALTHERPYKTAWSQSSAIAEIESLSGRQFDPAVVKAFLQIVCSDNKDEPLRIAA